MAAHDAMNQAQFYHGSAHKLKEGQLLTVAGARKAGRSKEDAVHSTTSPQGAAYYAALRAHDFNKGAGHVYSVYPSADVSPDTTDPDVSDQYRSSTLTVGKHLYSVERGEFA